MKANGGGGGDRKMVKKVLRIIRMTPLISFSFEIGKFHGKYSRSIPTVVKSEFDLCSMAGFHF